ncbi:ADYC domain-containing protein [Nannocystis exedens]|nr:ADYC domain-containing protein [Nannocystis exedens]
MLACDVDEAPRAVDDLDEVGARELEANGFRLNGTRFNGFRLNGFRLNGFRLDGDENSGNYVDLESFTLGQGGPVTHAWLAGSELRAKNGSGTVFGGAQLVGAVLSFGLVDNGDNVYRNRRLRIANVTRLAPGSEVWLYDLEVKDAVGVWQPLCDGPNGPTQAILVGAVWDPTTGSRVAAVSDAVTAACRDAAIGKCVEWGYHPWKLADYHQTCTRLVRADYCGDGIPHTTDNVMIHVVDEIGVQVPEPDASYAVEAEWDPNGATCLNAEHTRLPAPDIACVLPSCGEAFDSGGLIQTGVPAP